MPNIITFHLQAKLNTDRTAQPMTSSLHHARQSLMARAFRPDPSNLGRRVAVGVGWQVGLNAFRVLATLGSTAVLARLLAPADYGLVAMATLVTEFAALLSNFGFGAVLIQKSRLRRVQLDTMFWASLLMGVILLLLTVAASIPAALFFSEPRLSNILCVAGLSFLIYEASIVPSALLSRQLLFKIDAIIQAAQLLVRIACAIAMALAGLEYWSLVLAPLAAAVFSTVLLYIYTGFFPRLRFDIAFLRGSIGASTSYLGSGFLSYIMSNLDYFIVGKRFGTEQLGYYQVAYSIPDELRTKISGPLLRVLFPAFSIMHGAEKNVLSALVSAQRGLGLLVFPISAFILMNAAEIVELLYGRNWAPVVPLLQLLAVGGAARAVFSLTFNIFNSQGVPQLGLRLAAMTFPFVVALVLIGSHWGPIGVAVAMMLSNLLTLYSVGVAMRLAGGGLRDFFRSQVIGLSSAALNAIVSALIRFGLTDELSTVSRLASGACVLISYLLLICYVFRRKKWLF